MKNTYEIKELALMTIVTMLSVSATCASSNIIAINNAGVVINICAWVLMLVVGITALLFMVVSGAEYVWKSVQLILLWLNHKMKKQSSDVDMSVIA